MPTPDAITADEHINVIRGAAPTYMKGFADLTHRGHVLFALMKQHGMMEFNANDFSRNWQVRKSVLALTPLVRRFRTTTRTSNVRSTFATTLVRTC